MDTAIPDSTSPPGPREKPESPNGNVPGTALLSKALDIVEYVGGSERRLKFKDIADHTGHAKPTLYRILSALVTRQMLSIDRRDQCYILGSKFTELAATINHSAEVVSLSTGELGCIAQKYGEPASVGILSGNVCRVVGYWEGMGAKPMTPLTGERRPLYCTALGKSLLAFRRTDDMAVLMKNLELVPNTPKTLRTPEQLIGELAITRQRGYAVDDEENLLGAIGIAAPILDGSGVAIAAIGISAPPHRLPAARRLDIATDLMAVALRIGERLRPPVAQGGLVDLPAAAGTSFKVFDLRTFHVSHLMRHAPRRMVWVDGPGGVIGLLEDGRSTVIWRTAGHITGAHVDPTTGNVLFALNDWLWILRSDEGGWRAQEHWRHSALPDIRQLHPLSEGRLLVLSEADDGTLAVLHPGGRTSTLMTGIDACAGWHIDAETLHLVCRERGSIRRVSMARLADAAGPLAVEHETPLPPHWKELAALAWDGSRYWLARRQGWALAELSESGVMGKITALPLPSPASIAWEDSRTMLIGTSRLELSARNLDHSPLSGGILRFPYQDHPIDRP